MEAGAAVATTVFADRVAEAWPEAHHVVIAAPATDGTRHLVGAPELDSMREDAWLVNVARGSLVDTDALVAALRAGSIGGAALDVTDPEPLPDGHPLWDLPNVIVSPHNASASAGNEKRCAEMFIANFGHWIRGESMFNVQHLA